MFWDISMLKYTQDDNLNIICNILIMSVRNKISQNSLNVLYIFN